MAAYNYICVRIPFMENANNSANTQIESPAPFVDGVQTNRGNKLIQLFDYK